MKKLFLTAAAAAAVLTFAATAQASIIVDGALDAAAYGPAVASVTYDPAAPDSNFGAPTSASKYDAYSIYLKADGGAVYGFVAADPAGKDRIPGVFSDLYWSLDGPVRTSVSN